MPDLNSLVLELRKVYITTMNIFVLHTDPQQCAQMHCDKHVVKMILESAQMLSTANHVNNSSNKYLSELYKATHINHPCNVWIRKNIVNYTWLYDLFLALMDEYKFRYNKLHSCEAMVELLNPINYDWTEYEKAFVLDPSFAVVSDRPVCMPEDCKISHTVDGVAVYDVVTSYRSYYIADKLRFAKYTKRQVPSWITDKSWYDSIFN